RASQRHPRNALPISSSALRLSTPRASSAFTVSRACHPLSCLAHSLLGPHWNRKEKGRALSRARFGPDTPTVHFDNMPGDRETQSGSARFLRDRAVRLLKLFENSTLISRIDARSSITN